MYEKKENVAKAIHPRKGAVNTTGPDTDSLFSTPLIFPDTLYGRSEQRRIILEQWENIRHKKQVLSVCGPSGVGKSALIHSIGSRLRKQKQRFVHGKFDLTRNQLPYSAVVSALTQIAEWILSRNQKDFKRWKNRINTALKGNAGLMVDIVPILENILGPQTPPPDLSPLAEKNRFEYLFEQFIRSMACAREPLLIFIDDLQWADAPSMDLIRSICLKEDLEYILFIGAYRDNEMAPDHPWLTLLEELKNNSRPPLEINVPPLALNHVQQFLGDALGCSLETVHGPAKVILNKTGGIPIVIKQFLLSLVKKNCLVFHRENSKWEWDLSFIRTLPVHENAAAFILERINIFQKQELETLVTAACLGNRFNAAQLAFCCGSSFQDVARVLSKAEKIGIVFSCYMGADETKPSGASMEDDYAFSHDSFQKGLLGTLSEQALHLKSGRIGMKLLTRPGPAFSSDELLLAIGLLNEAPIRFHNPRDLHRFAQLNCDSGNITLNRMAYEAALAYFTKGIEYLDAAVGDIPELETIWLFDKKLALNLYEGAAQASFFLSRFDIMDKFIHCADEQENDPLKKTKLYEIKTNALHAANRMDQAIDVAFDYAEKLGVRWPKYPGKKDILVDIIKIQYYFRNKPIHSFAQLPLMTDARYLAALRVLSCVTLAALSARPNLMPLIIVKSLLFSVKHGITESTAFTCAGYGYLLCGIMNRQEQGYRFGQLAMAFIKKYNFKSIEGKVVVSTQTLINHWKSHLRETTPLLLDGIRTGFETGDHQFAALGAKNYCSFCFIYGRELSGLYKDVRKFTDLVRPLKQSVILDGFNILSQVISTLSTCSPVPLREQNLFADNLAAGSETLDAADNPSVQFYQNCYSLFLCLLFNKDRQAQAFGDAAMALRNSTASAPMTYCFFYFDSLALLSILNKSPAWTRRKYIRRIRRNLKKLKKWSVHAPMNILHKHDLVLAMLYAHYSENDKADDYFDRAVKGAEKNSYINDQALAAEYAGRHYLALENDSLACRYLSLAYDSYFKWGAYAKVEDMEQRYPSFVFKEKKLCLNKAALQKDRREKPDGALGYHPVLKASQIISKEDRLSNILKQLVRLSMENLSARKAVVLLFEGQELKIQALAEKKPEHIDVLQNIAFDTRPDLVPVSLVNYVARTNKALVLDDALQEDVFCHDPYVSLLPCLSVLCAPVFMKNVCGGILYLENDLRSCAFDENQLNYLNALLSQVVATIENFRLYETLHLEKKLKDAAQLKLGLQQDMLKNMSAELAAVEERERKNIANDLHDSVVQSMALSVLRLKKLKNSIPLEHRDQVTIIQDKIEQAVGQIRSLTFRISPKILYDLGLIAAFEWLAEDMKTRYGLEVALINELPDPERGPGLSETAKITLYRAVRELLLNTYKHAQTGLAVVQVKGGETDLTIVVKDNGKGFDHDLPVDTHREGFGLISLQERIQSLGGFVNIDSINGQGTRIMICIPVLPV